MKVKGVLCFPAIITNSASNRLFLFYAFVLLKKSNLTKIIFFHRKGRASCLIMKDKCSCSFTTNSSSSRVSQYLVHCGHHHPPISTVLPTTHGFSTDSKNARYKIYAITRQRTKLSSLKMLTFSLQSFGLVSRNTDTYAHGEKKAWFHHTSYNYTKVIGREENPL